ncbi:MAG: efflux RND transporter periplasmic adaptor subunit [Ignavibacteriales bacterium]|nr:efflux RND transporter periplasmic adaptor subunit [Ignavibacteriales bacterium]
MKNIRIIIVTAVVLAAIIAILFYNKSRSTAKSTSEMLSSMSVSVTKAGKQTIASTRSMVGTIAANNDVAIISETSGKVIAVHAEVGQHVIAGATIVQVDDELKKAAYISAETNYEKAKKDLERFEMLYKQNSATEQQIEGARLAIKAAEAQYIAARRQYNDTKISTPISGIVTSRTVDVGTYVSNNMPVANVVDISRLKVKINVSESDAFCLKVGDKVQVGTDVYPGIKYAGKIKSISSKADEAHTYPVEVTLENSKQHPLKAGMFGRISFTSKGNTEILAIPREALVGSMKTPQVYIVEGNIARIRNIVAGSEVGNFISVLEGLKEGDVIVTNGQNNLQDSVAVTIIK